MTTLSAATELLLVQPPQMLPARMQMAFTLMAHIILVPLGVALPFITLVMNYIGLRRGTRSRSSSPGGGRS